MPIKESDDDVDPSIKLVYKGAKKIKNVKYVGAPPPGYQDSSNFDTLWSVTFTATPGPDDSIEETLDNSEPEEPVPVGSTRFSA